MKGFVWSLAAAVACTLTFNAVTTAEEEQQDKTVKRFVAKSDDGNAMVFVATGEGDETVDVQKSMHFNVVVAGEDGENAHVIQRVHGGPGAVWVGEDGDRHAVNLAHFAEEDPNAGWLGIQLGAFKDIENGVESSGITVLNVAKGSPADVAGFEKDDAIVEVDDVAMTDDISGFVDVVKQSSAGERVKFTVMRDGERRTLVAVLGQRSEARDVEWLYESENSFTFKDGMHSRVKVLRRADGGDWNFEVLDEDADLSMLPGNIADMLPRFRTHTINVTAGEDGDSHIAIKVIRDGEGLEVETTEDGEIQVTRSTDGGDETVDVYATAEELEAGDPEAYELYANSQNHMVIDLHGAHLGDLGDGAFAFTFEPDMEFEWVEDMEDRLEEESGALAEALERLKDIRVNVGTGAMSGEGNTFFEFVHGRANQTIRENPDGTIDVIVRKGENELVTRYADEADLEARNPDAYETFLDLKSPGE